MRRTGTPAQADNADTLDGQDSSDFLGPDQLAITSAQGFDWLPVTEDIALAATGTTIIETSIDTPASGHLLLIGNAAVGSSITDGSFYVVWIEIDDGSCGITGLTPDNSVTGATTYAVDGTADDYSTGVNGVAPVSEGTHTVTLYGANDAGDGEAFNASVVAQFLSNASVFEVTSSSLSQTGASGPDN